jgi:hypothetical protein
MTGERSHDLSDTYAQPAPFMEQGDLDQADGRNLAQATTLVGSGECAPRSFTEPSRVG